MKPTKPLCAFVLSEYPKVKKRLRMYEKYLMATKINPGGPEIKVSGGNGKPIQEVWCDIRFSDPFVIACDEFIQMVERGLNTLSSSEYALIYSKYFSSPYGAESDVDIESDKSKATVRRTCDKILDRIERCLIEAWLIWDRDIRNFNEA